MLKFHLFMVVWGDAYIETMVGLAIPTLLYDDNLPALAARHDCKMVFFTRASEEARIRHAPSVARLARLMPIEFVSIDPDSAVDAYAAMNAAHYRGCLAAKEAGARAIFLFPDGVFANGSLARAGQYAEQGKVAVICAGPLLSRDTALPALLPRVESDPLSCRELVALMRAHLHPQLRRNFIDSWDFSIWPIFVCWSLGPKGMLIRGLHLHPLMIDLSRIGSFESLKERTVDCTLLGETLDDWSDVQVETDSDNICICSLTAKAATNFNESWYRRFEFLRLHNTAYGPLFNALHRHYFTKALKFHVGDLDDEWRRIEEDTAWIAEALQEPPLSAVIHQPPRWPVRLVGKVITGVRDLLTRASRHQY